MAWCRGSEEESSQSCSRLNNSCQSDTSLIPNDVQKHSRVLFGLVPVRTAFILIRVVSCVFTVFTVEELMIQSEAIPPEIQEYVSTMKRLDMMTPTDMEHYSRPAMNAPSDSFLPAPHTVFNADVVSKCLVGLFFIDIIALYGLSIGEGRSSNVFRMSGPSSRSHGLCIVLICMLYGVFCSVLVHGFQFLNSSGHLPSALTLFTLKLVTDIWTLFVDIQTIRYLAQLCLINRKDTTTEMPKLLSPRHRHRTPLPTIV